MDVVATVRTAMHSVALLLIAVLALVAPVDAVSGLDIHGGEAFHPIFAHPHPETPSSDDELAAVAAGQPALQGAHAFEPGGPVAVGQALPHRPVPVELTESTSIFARVIGISPTGFSSPPPDPPPELV